MLLNVSDARSNPRDQIMHAVEILGRSAQRRAVFEAIYNGKRKVKTISEIQTATGLPLKRVYNEARRLASNNIVHQTKKGNEVAYEKDQFYHIQKRQILSLCRDKRKREKFPTKVRPRPISQQPIVFKFSDVSVKARFVSIEDIDSFTKAKKVSKTKVVQTPISESIFKEGLKKIIGEEGEFTDWGGERNDFLTTRLKIKRKRMYCPTRSGTNWQEINLHSRLAL